MNRREFLQVSAAASFLPMTLVPSKEPEIPPVYKGGPIEIDFPTRDEWQELEDAYNDPNGVVDSDRDPLPHDWYVDFGDEKTWGYSYVTVKDKLPCAVYEDDKLANADFLHNHYFRTGQTLVWLPRRFALEFFGPAIEGGTRVWIYYKFYGRVQMTGCKNSHCQHTTMAFCRLCAEAMMDLYPTKHSNEIERKIGLYKPYD